MISKQINKAKKGTSAEEFKERRIQAHKEIIMFARVIGKYYKKIM